MGRYATSLVLKRSPDATIKLAVIGDPAGMSTRAPLPATSAMSVNDCGGGGRNELSCSSEAWIWVRALMLVLATTTFVPVTGPCSSERLARPAAVAKASTARIAPTTMYRRPRGGARGPGGGVDILLRPAACHGPPIGATHSTRTASTNAVLIPASLPTALVLPPLASSNRVPQLIEPAIWLVAFAE